MGGKPVSSSVLGGKLVRVLVSFLISCLTVPVWPKSSLASVLAELKHGFSCHINIVFNHWMGGGGMGKAQRALQLEKRWR